MIIAVGAGIRIGAAFFDLIPEAIEHLGSLEVAAMLWTAVGFLAFYAIEQAHARCTSATRPPPSWTTTAPPTSTSAWSARPGWASTRSSTASRWPPAWPSAAGSGSSSRRSSIVHRFSDGIGVVSFLLASNAPPSTAWRWVALVAVAPVARRPRRVDPARSRTTALGAILGFFAGFFLYVGAAELLPEAHRRDRSRAVVAGDARRRARDLPVLGRGRRRSAVDAH